MCPALRPQPTVTHSPTQHGRGNMCHAGRSTVPPETLRCQGGQPTLGAVFGLHYFPQCPPSGLVPGRAPLTPHSAKQGVASPRGLRRTSTRQ